jgi:hypothetical protein
MARHHVFGLLVNLQDKDNSIFWHYNCNECNHEPNHSILHLGTNRIKTNTVLWLEGKGAKKVMIYYDGNGRKILWLHAPQLKSKFGTIPQTSV